MKKKIITLIFAFVLTLCCLASCVNVSYDHFNQLVKQKYTKINLEITTAKNNEELKTEISSFFNGDTTEITYSMQQYSVFGEENGEITAPDEYIVTLTGSATVRNGEIISQNGDQAAIPLEQITPSGLTFDETYFSYVNHAEKNRFHANVTKPREFTGNDTLDGCIMSVDVSYGYSDKTGRDELVSLLIDYDLTDGTNVTIKYTFEA